MMMMRPNGTIRTRLDGAITKKHLEIRMENKMVDADGLHHLQCLWREMTCQIQMS